MSRDPVRRNFVEEKREITAHTLEIEIEIESSYLITLYYITFELGSVSKCGIF